MYNINTTKLKLYKDNIWRASLSVGAENLKLFCNLLAVYKIGERFFDRLALICVSKPRSLLCPWAFIMRCPANPVFLKKRIIFYIIQKDIARRF